MTRANRLATVLLLLAFLSLPAAVLADGITPIWRIDGPGGRYGVGFADYGGTTQTVLFLSGHMNLYVPVPPETLGIWSGIVLLALLAGAGIFVWRGHSAGPRAAGG